MILVGISRTTDLRPMSGTPRIDVRRSIWARIGRNLLTTERVAGRELWKRTTEMWLAQSSLCGALAIRNHAKNGTQTIMSRGAFIRKECRLARRIITTLVIISVLFAS